MCSLSWGRLMSRWVSSKLTSVSDGASPGQAFYHRSSIIGSHSKTHKVTDSKAAASQKTKKHRGRAAPRSHVAAVILNWSADQANVADLAVRFFSF